MSFRFNGMLSDNVDKCLEELKNSSEQLSEKERKNLFEIHEYWKMYSKLELDQIGKLDKMISKLHL
jgi:hypothetical protein